MSLLIIKLKSLFLIILSAFKRALCCFRKRRRNSHCESEILTTIGIVPAYSNTSDSKTVKLCLFSFSYFNSTLKLVNNSIIKQL